MSTQLPYENLSDLKLKNDEPLTYAYFNVHILRLLQNIQSINKTTTLQKATTTQWGVVRFATVDDIISENGDRNTVISNKVLNEAVETLTKNNQLKYQRTGKLSLSKNYEWVHGEFSVGLGENIAKKITTIPDNVVYANVYFVPLGYENKIFRTATTKKNTDAEYFKNNTKTTGFINFDKISLPTNYEEFHVYYHKAGYIICRNGRIQDDQKQIKVVWNLLLKK